MFEGIFDDGIPLSTSTITTETMDKHFPEYLKVDSVIHLTLDARVDPTSLRRNCAYVYGDNLYLSDRNGNLAYIDCEMVFTANATEIKRMHPEYKRTGGRYASSPNTDAGHLGVQLGQHPSITLAQDATMNRYGSWRTFEKNWLKLIKDGHKVNIKAVFVEDQSGGAFSPFWCICETIDGIEEESYALLNDAEQY